MSSPVSIPFSSFVKTDRRRKDAVYLQIVYQFINAVKSSILEEGDRLPGSRIIAEDLGLHRKTVVAALTELQEQGWIETRPNIGSFVRNPEPGRRHEPVQKNFRKPPDRAPYPFRKEFILDSHPEDRSADLYFTDGTPDYRLIPTGELARFYTSVIRRQGKSGFLRTHQSADEFFREQLSFYLNLTRGFHISREHLLPVGGPEQVHSVLARLLIRKGDVVLVEELSYFLPNMIYSQAGAVLTTVPVDEEGMCTDFIREHFGKGTVRAVYLNSRCQYPTTAPLSDHRKKALLNLATELDFVIIEDDSDFEFSGSRTKRATLLNQNGSRVIYTGAFGRFMNPGFQMHYIIAPKDLLFEGAKYLRIFGQPDLMMQKALGELIHQGDIHRYQRKSRKSVSERKAFFAEHLMTAFGGDIAFSTPKSGLAFWIRFKKRFSLTELQRRALGKGLFIPAVCLYQNRNITALRLGFAHLLSGEAENALRILAEAYSETIQDKTGN